MQRNAKEGGENKMDPFLGSSIESQFVLWPWTGRNSNFEDLALRAAI